MRKEGQPCPGRDLLAPFFFFVTTLPPTPPSPSPPAYPQTALPGLKKELKGKAARLRALPPIACSLHGAHDDLDEYADITQRLEAASARLRAAWGAIKGGLGVAKLVLVQLEPGGVAEPAVVLRILGGDKAGADGGDGRTYYVMALHRGGPPKGGVGAAPPAGAAATAPPSAPDVGMMVARRKRDDDDDASYTVSKGKGGGGGGGGSKGDAYSGVPTGLPIHVSIGDLGYVIVGVSSMHIVSICRGVLKSVNTHAVLYDRQPLAVSAAFEALRRLDRGGVELLPLDPVSDLKVGDGWPHHCLPA